MPENLDQIAAAAPEDVEIASVRIALQALLDRSARLCMPRRMSVWPVAIQTLTPLGIGIIAVSEAQGPAAALQGPRPGQRERDSRRQARSR